MAEVNTPSPIEEAKQKKFEKDLNAALAPYPVPEFDTAVVTDDSLNEMTKAHELKYIEYVLQAAEENRLIEENAKDFRQHPAPIQKRALEINADPKVKYNPNYFQENRVDNALIKPVQQLQAIEAKREEARNKSWKVEYHARLVERLRGLSEKLVRSREEVEKADGGGRRGWL